ncbi:MAG: invasion associated locus B family protein, partial [Alphaproteobacteria bacterium]|nr:invasion associated locus B family protein [Alphaproteobacteria bacterium]
HPGSAAGQIDDRKGKIVNYAYQLIVAGMALALASTAQAQTAQAQTADGAETGPTEQAAQSAEAETGASEEDALGSTYVAGEYDDWQLQCVRVELGAPAPCRLYQLVQDSRGTPVAEFGLFLLRDNPNAEAGADITTPLETLLTRRLALSVDTSEPKVYPFTFCAVQGCVSRVGLTPDEVSAMKAGNVATIRIFNVKAAQSPIDLEVSLKGFTAAYEALIASQ